MAEPTDPAFDEAAWRDQQASLEQLSFIYVDRGVAEDGDREDTDYSRWIRRKFVWGDDPAEAFSSPSFVNDVFWNRRDPYNTFLLSILQGNVRCDDTEFLYADEPRLWLPVDGGGYSKELVDLFNRYKARLAADRSLGRKYTVIFGWDKDCPPPNVKRNSDFVVAIDPTHAELITRAKRTDASTAPLVGSVHALWVHPVDSWELDVYATPDGQPLPPPPAPAPEKKRFGGLFS